MKSSITLTPAQKTENLIIKSADFPRQIFNYHIPEIIGSTNREDAYFSTASKTPAKPDWEPIENDGWKYSWTQPKVLSYTVQAKPGLDYVDVHIKLKNLSDNPWPESTAFSCYNFHKAINFGDFEGTRTFLLIDGKWRSLMQIERKDSHRPLIQLFYVKGRSRPLGLVEMHRATPPVYPNCIFAVRSYDGKSVTAVTTDRPLYLFHNLEYSCIHCCPSFGALKPGQEGRAMHRAFICKNTTLDDIAARARAIWKNH